MDVDIVVYIPYEGAGPARVIRQACGSEETVGDIDSRIVSFRLISNQATPASAARAEQAADEGAASDVGTSGLAHQSAFSVSSGGGGVDGDAALHVGQREFGRAVKSHHASGMFVAGGDGSGGDEVLDGGTIGVAECAADIFTGLIVDGDGVAVAVEGAVEGVVRGAHHRGDADVIGQLEVRAVVGGTY